MCVGWKGADPGKTLRETLVHSWGFVRLVHEPTNLYVVSEADRTHSLETGTHPQNCYDSCGNDSHSLWSHSKMDHCDNILCPGRVTPGTWAPARGSDLGGKCAPPELFSPTHNEFSVPNYFQGKPLAGATLQPPNFWHSERWPAWDRLSIFPCFPSGARIHGWVHLLKPQKEKEFVLVQQGRDRWRQSRVWQGLALAIRTEFELALPPKGTEINEVCWEVVEDNRRARAWAASVHNTHTPWEWCCWGLGNTLASCVSPTSFVFPLWDHSLQALTWADVMYLSFSLAVCTKEMSFVIKGAHSGSCKKIFWTLLFLCF